MILADKIMTLRKKTGWSQEELAAQLNVSRQSVSKWEGAQSIPDMDKVVQMSRLFGVTTDFLLKDELEMEEHTQSTPIDEPPLRRVTIQCPLFPHGGGGLRLSGAASGSRAEDGAGYLPVHSLPCGLADAGGHE